MKIVIIDYGLGNIFSIQRAIRFVGFTSQITDRYEEIVRADRVILPGVGAFGDGMRELKRKELDKAIREYADAGKPILGICLGMQLLMGMSEEFGQHEGLNLISGKVLRFPAPKPRGVPYKIPHVGWNQVYPARTGQSSWNNTVLTANKPNDFFYFVHSYRVIPDSNEDILAKTEYGGVEFCSVVKKANVTGCQFHPELSGEAGLKIYQEFMKDKTESYHDLTSAVKELS